MLGARSCAGAGVPDAPVCLPSGKLAMGARLPREALRMRSRRHSGQHVALSFPEASPGFAVVISKKTLASSTDRHRLRRRILAVLRVSGSKLAVVAYPRASALRLPPKELKAEIVSLLPK